MKSFFGFLGCIAIAALLAYYITGTGGLFILFLMIIALVLDLLISAVSFGAFLIYKKKKMSDNV